MNKINTIKREIAEYVGEPIEAVKRNSTRERFRLNRGDFSIFDTKEERTRNFRILGWKYWAEIV